ncbi:pentatricopeptide repeat-containing protein At5g39680-like [Coffea eugenioides]|uniref:pentatricopeptide repeat-containing protein At5g39680-like n=1 Tax=Coffea eugenioides TaxID=49369 RepID=UPI000F607D4C|nr:pentatricopeptide repeat-containing protein At5g39680-like [Coffea eugenioides]
MASLAGGSPSMPAQKPPLDPRSVINWQAPWRLKSNHDHPAVKLLKISAGTKNLKFGKIIHAHLLVSDQASENNVVENNTLLNLYAKCGQLSGAQRVFDGMRMRNVVSWGTLMAGYFHAGFCSEVLELSRDMVKVDNLRLNKYVLSTVLSGCAGDGLYCKGQQCHGYAEKSGLIFNQHVKNALVCMYSMCEDVDGAMRVFNGVPGLDIFTYNSLLTALLEHRSLSEALDVFRKLLEADVEWDGASYVGVLGLCACLKYLKLGSQVHSRMLKSGFNSDMFVNCAMIDMYGKFGEITKARKAFGSLKARNVVSWTAILAACLQNECFEEALKLFFEMETDGVRPNEYTFAVLLNSSASLSAVAYGTSLHAHIEKVGYEDFVIVGNALVNMYSRNGDIELAYSVFAKMRSRDPITWNSMISGYSHHGLGKEALTVFRDMLAAEEKPNYVTFIGVLSACGHLGQVEQGFYYLNHSMNMLGIEPGLEHYTCIIGLLGKAGQLDEAENFMRSMPVKWDIVAWRTLLNACHVQRNYRVGMRAAEVILRMDPNDVGTCILLSNMHAKFKRWDGVVKMRKLMRERNIKKEPGLSWTEIRNNTHIFIAGDNKHPESVQIQKKVRELLAEIKPLGYVPDQASALHDVEEEQTVDYLTFHSEKLAIAYALMKTPPNAPIRVIKNLRICDDCHSAAKLISKVTNRLIVIRDANHFHTFRNGICSCADYW